MMFDGENQLQTAAMNEQPMALKIVAKIFSYIFHPVFVPVYIVYFMLFIHPNLFAGFQPFDKTKTLIMGFVMYTFFPIVTTLLLKALNFISDFHLTTQKDRIIPLLSLIHIYEPTRPY